jgi:DNA repair photolyase
MQPIETEAKSIITESKLPDADYVINPYTGCVFGCAYCYASFMGRFVNEPIEAWGDYLYVKTNAVELADAELRRMPAAKREGTVLLSSVTDPYQGAETKYRLTRGILSKLLEHKYPGLVSILTKSPIVTRDIDIISELPRSEVGMTVTTTDDKVSRWLEVRAPIASRRIRTLAELNAAGLRTYAFVGPLLPHFVTAPELLDTLLGQIAGAGVREVYIEHMNLKRYIRERMTPVLASEPNTVQTAYANARTDEHRQRLDAIVAPLLEKHGLTLRLNEVIYHDKPKADDNAVTERGQA